MLFVVISVHSFGNLLNFHPLPTMSLAPTEGLFRHRVFKMLLRKGLPTPERIRLMKSWEHSGLNVNAAVRIGAADASGRENLARYLIRAPFPMNKIRYDPAARTVIYKTKMVAGPNRNFEIFDPLDFLAAADYGEPDLMDTKNGYLIARNEPNIIATTNVGSLPQFASTAR